MKSPKMSQLLLGLLAAAALIGCKDSLYCKSSSDCSGATPFCDVNGTVGGIGHTCIAMPNPMNDAMVGCDMPSDCSGATPACNVTTHLCVECTDNTTCPTAEEPLCNTTSNMCGGCTSDTNCVGRSDGRVACDTGTGICEECTDNTDCTAAAEPVCDTTSKTCRACSLDSECPSGVCNTLDGDAAKGQCVAEADVIYVNRDADAGNMQCTSAAKCNSLAKGVTAVGTPATRKWILIDASAVAFAAPTVTIDDKTVVIKGAGATVRSSVDSTPAVIVSGTSNVTIEGLKLTAPLAPTATDDGSDGIRCTDASDTPTLVLRGVTLEGSKGQGFHAATACNVTIAGSTISSNAGGGVTATGGTITITGSTINSNAGGGVSMSAANFTVVNNFFWDNGAGGSLFGALEITHAGMPNPKRVEFNTIVSNNAGSPQPAGVKCTLTSTAVAAKHNIVHDNDRDGSNSQIGAFGGPNGCTWTFSLVTDAGFSATGGNINGPVPTFVALGSGNLHLSPSSPSGINGGDTTGTDVTIDIDGQARANGVPDIGADEVHP